MNKPRNFLRAPPATPEHNAVVSLESGRICTAIVTAGVVLSMSGAAFAQGYPAKPIRFIVPFASGGPNDIVARILAQKLTESFKQTVVVDNRPGGGGAIGAESAVRATPDGYTLIIVATSYATNAALVKPPYDPLNDVTPIVLIGESGSMVTLHPALPVTSIRELIAYDRNNPGKLNYGSGGTGSSNHLGTELFNQMAGTRMTHVPYKGGGPALNDLLGGQIQLIIGSMPALIPHVKSSRLRGIAVTTAKRTSAAPDTPAVAESVPGYEAVNWYSILGPKALPQHVVARWNTGINRLLELQEVRQRLAGDGMTALGGAPERSHEVLVREIPKWQNVVRIANIKAGT